MSRRRLLLSLLIGLPVSAGFLWLAVRNADLGAVRSALEDAERGPVVLAVVGLAAVNGAQAVRWREISAVRTIGWGRFYEMVVSGVACNNVLPARIGDLLRARWLATTGHMSSGQALGSVVLDRSCDLAALLFLLLVGLVGVATTGWAISIAIGTAFVLGAVGGVVVFARVYTGRRVRERRERNVLRRIARDVAEALAAPMGWRRPLLWLAISFGAWAIWAASAILVAHALAFHLGIVDALFVAGAMNLGIAIPSSPGFVGTYEWLGVAALGLLDVPAEQALAFAILIHACWYFPSTVVGGTVLLTRGLTGSGYALSRPSSETAAKEGP